MILGEDTDFDELLLDSVLFVFVLSSFNFSRGGPILGSQSTKNTHMRGNITINVESSQHR